MIDIPASDRRHLLITGATGLLGSYVVRDLLLDGQPLALVVRGDRRTSPEARVDRIVAAWESELGKRLPRPRVVPGDLSRPSCGVAPADLEWVARHCGAVLHNAASLSFRGSDRDAEPWLSNVTGTAHVLGLAHTAGIDEFHHVSTAYVCGLRTGRVTEEELLVGQAFGNDYERSKAEAETMVRSEGPRSVTVYRPSIIVGDSRSGFTSTYHGLFAVLRLGHTLLTKVELGSTSGPAILTLLGIPPADRKNFVPVDWVSAVISHCLQSPSARGRTFHVTHPEPVSSAAIGRLVQEAVETYSRAASADDPDLCDERWFADNLAVQLDVYRSYFRNDPTFDRTATDAVAGGIPCPPLDHATLMRMARFAIEDDFGRSPRRRRTAAPFMPRPAATSTG
ncbi:MAG: SDR family oxidoreductase [Planctomycetaceae bacterium]